MAKKTIAALIMALALVAFWAAPAMARPGITLSTESGEVLKPEQSLHMWSTTFRENFSLSNVQCAENEMVGTVVQNPNAVDDLIQFRQEAAGGGERCVANGGLVDYKFIWSNTTNMDFRAEHGVTAEIPGEKLTIKIYNHGSPYQSGECEYVGNFIATGEPGSPLKLAMGVNHEAGAEMTRVSYNNSLCSATLSLTGSFEVTSGGEPVVASVKELPAGLYANTGTSNATALAEGDGLRFLSHNTKLVIQKEKGVPTLSIECAEALLTGEATTPASSPAQAEVKGTSFTGKEMSEWCATSSINLKAKVTASAAEPWGVTFSDQAGKSALGEFQGPIQISMDIYTSGGAKVTTCVYEAGSIGFGYSFEKALGLKVTPTTLTRKSGSVFTCQATGEVTGEFEVTSEGTPVEVVAN